jgi:hypothetical protein
LISTRFKKPPPENTRGKGNTGQAERSSCWELFPFLGGVFRAGCQGEPGREGSELFVLGPGRAEGTAQLGDAAREVRGIQMKSLLRAIEELSFLDGQNRESTAGAGVEESFAKEFPVGSVDQSVRGKNFLQARERPRGSEEKAATRELVALFTQTVLKAVDCAISEASCLGLHARDKGGSLCMGHFFGCVVGLAEFVSKNFNEMDALALKN